MKEAYTALSNVQQELHAPKDQNNTFGGYKYRSCESILEAVKPILKKHGAIIWITDDVKEVGGRIYIEATAHFSEINTGQILNVSASARESLTKKGMDDSQVTGATSSYARKYALNGLLLIDDNKDADSGSPEEHEADKEAEAQLKQEAEDARRLHKYRLSSLDAFAKYERPALEYGFESVGLLSEHVGDEEWLKEVLFKVDSIDQIKQIGAVVKAKSKEVGE